MGVDVDRAVDLLAEVDQVRRLTRRSTRVFAFPFLLYGTAALLAAGLTLVAPVAVGGWWAAVSVVGGVAVWRHYRTRAVALGVSQGWRRYAVVWGLAAVGFGLVFGLAPPATWYTLPWAVVGASYLVLGGTGDGPQMVAVGAALCVVAATPLAGVPAGAPSDAIAGVLLLAGGAASHWLSRGVPS